MGAPEGINPEHWGQLTAAGPAIARAVAVVAGGAKDTQRELEAFLAYASRESEDGSPVLATLIADTLARVASGASATGDPYQAGLTAAREAGAVLATAVPETDAAAIRAWLLGAARSVAAAAREGGVLGIGGHAVSGAEEETIAEIADALGA